MGGVAKNAMSGHRLYAPEVHVGQAPHGTPGSSATRSPTARWDTPLPSATTVPDDSCPITMGALTTNGPMEPCKR